MNILIVIATLIEGIIGIASTLSIIVMLIGTISYKIYRKIRYGASLYD